MEGREVRHIVVDRDFAAHLHIPCLFHAVAPRMFSARSKPRGLRHYRPRYLAPAAVVPWEEGRSIRLSVRTWGHLVVTADIIGDKSLVLNSGSNSCPAGFVRAA